MTTCAASSIISDDHARVGNWMQVHNVGTYRPGCVCIGCEQDGRLRAAVMYDYFNGASIFASIAVAGRFSKDWLYAICHYPFIHLGCLVVIAMVSSHNGKSQRFCEKFGFKLQCALPDADPDGAMLIYTLRKQDCRFLRRDGHG